MNLLGLMILTAAFLMLGYRIYGRFLSRHLFLKETTPTPAHTFQNDVDFVPANKFYLLGQHLSAIAAAGPIVGPILAGMWFGWGPTVLWIVLGGVFIGGVHDMVSLVASLRHQGRSIADVIKEATSPRAFILFLLFLWFSLIYIITAFTDITASTFSEPQLGAPVASSSMMYLVVAVLMGVTLKKFSLSLLKATLFFLPLVLACILLGPLWPLQIKSIPGLDIRMTWNILLLFYCAIAAVVPVWLLLQPRGYLGGFFLLFTAGLSLLGIMIGQFTQNYTIVFPAFKSWTNTQGLPLLPILFTTVACGACSGFHCLISSGTTSKQLNKETDARFVGYGGMLLESLVAVVALSTLMILPAATPLKDPNQIYASGIATFLNALGIPKAFAFNLALLAFATFVYDTLDVTTRLGRYIFEELTGWKNRFSPYLATFLTLLLPAVFLMQRITDTQGNVIPSWKVFWTVFGSSNQLLAALVLFGLSLWMYRRKMKYQIVLWPSLFMMGVALSSLALLIKPWVLDLCTGQRINADPIGITGLILMGLTGILVFEGCRILRRD